MLAVTRFTFTSSGIFVAPVPGPPNTPTVTPMNTPTPTSTSTLAAYWNFDQSTPDRIHPAVRHLAMAHPSEGAIQPGFYVHSLQFIGAGQYFNVPRTANLEPTNGLTVSMWVYPLQI